MTYEGSLRVADARQRYYDANGFGSDGGDSEKWVKLKLFGVIPFGFPNSDARRKAVRLHDLHHVATGYHTTWTGEAEIGGWEVGAGCGRYWVAWVLNLAAMGYGMFLAPRRVIAAYRRGRRSKSLYHLGWTDDLLTLSVAQLRERLELR
jgi:hypothetical protein